MSAGWRIVIVALVLASAAGQASAANSAPVIDGSPAIVLPTVAVGATSSAMTITALLPTGSTGNWNDADGNRPGIAIVGDATNPTLGYWEYLDANAVPATWARVNPDPLNAPLSDANAVLLQGATGTSDRLRFVSVSGGAATYSLSVRGWDGSDFAPTGPGSVSGTGTTTAYSTAIVAVSIAVSASVPTNNAPFLDTSDSDIALASTAIGWTADPGTTVSALLAADLGGNAISDGDGPSKGIAITAASAGTFSPLGSWQYDTGAGWTTFPSVSNTNALLLLADGVTRIRFAATAGAGTRLPIAFQAWDASDGRANGGTRDVSNFTSGGSFSSASETDAAIFIAATTGALTYAGSTPSFANDLSVRGSTRYLALGASTQAGADRFRAAVAARGAGARAFAWDATTQAYVEFPAQPAGGLTAAHGIFLATKQDFAVDVSGAVPAWPYDVVLLPGWNFISMPALTNGAAVLTSHPWNDIDLISPAGTALSNSTTPTFAFALGSSAAGPWQWDGSAYARATTLDASLGYWVFLDPSLTTGTYRLRRLTGTSAVAGTRSVRAARDAASASASTAMPPKPPAGGVAAHGGCGSGAAGAIAAVGLLLALRLRRARG